MSPAIAKDIREDRVIRTAVLVNFMGGLLVVNGMV
jgi:hypothetical protein